jgi:hypothetical protein
MQATDTQSMEQRLAALGARIDELLDSTSQAELSHRLKGELDVWRRWIEEARIQAALGAMEGHDRLHSALRSLEHLYASMRKQLDLQDATEPLPGLDRAIREELRDASKTLAGPDAFDADRAR